MRCIACGAEMRLMHAVPDETMMVSGYEHQTFMCLACGEIERRLTFSGETGSGSVESVPAHDAPSMSPSAATPGLFKRVAAMLWGRHAG